MKQKLHVYNFSPSLLWSSSLCFDCLIVISLRGEKRDVLWWRQTCRWTTVLVLKIRGFLIVKGLVLRINIMNYIKYICSHHPLCTNQIGTNRHLRILFVPILFNLSCSEMLTGAIAVFHSPHCLSWKLESRWACLVFNLPWRMCHVPTHNHGCAVAYPPTLKCCLRVLLLSQFLYYLKTLCCCCWGYSGCPKLVAQIQ